MKPMYFFLIAFLSTPPLVQGLPTHQPAENREVLGACLKGLDEVLIRDITSPPVASRNYAYTFISFYEAARQGTPGESGLAGKVNALTSVPNPVHELDWTCAGAWAFYFTAKDLVFSKMLWETEWAPIEKKLHVLCQDTALFESAKAYGETVSRHIKQWYAADGYARTRSLNRYTPLKSPGSWQQTAPAYMAGVEPNWNKIRPMVLQSADQCKPIPPTPFDTSSGSDFYKQMYEVYQTGQQLSAEQKAIADFWDCNPWAAQYIGHISYAIKKISPGGHWMGITRIAVEQANLDLVEAARTYALVSIGLFDAFISCWDEKYRSNYIRPVTAIQTLISPVWTPYLQTPPFPEYTSGHSVASRAASTVLTSLLGEKFAFTDDSELPYGLPPRTFQSFHAAADEAAISRLYGGIHFMPAIEKGKEMGAQIGSLVITKLPH